MNKDIEKSIIKRFRKEIWAKFVKAVKEYELIEENDKIAVCISGGKDSFLLAKCMQELLRHGKFHYDLEFIIMDPGYNEENLNKIKENLEIMELKAHIFKVDIFEYVETTDNPCYLCAKMRRGHLYNFASSLGCNKIALGHHFNDVIETVLLNMLFNGTYGSMPPKLPSDNFPGMELIRPLYFIREKDISSWVRYNNLSFMDCGCLVAKKDIGKRKVIKNLVDDLNNIYPEADKNIFKATENVNLNTLLGYKKGTEKHSFLDEYDDKK